MAAQHPVAVPETNHEIHVGNEPSDREEGGGIPLALPGLETAESTTSSPSRLSSESDNDDEGEGELQPSTPFTWHTMIGGSFATLGFHRATQNRIKYVHILPGGKWDPKRYTPVFFHDIMMLPGSLAALLEKRSSEHIISRYTPAILKGFHAYIHEKTQQSCLLPSSADGDHVKGMIIFGQGTRARRIIHRHYRGDLSRVKVKVEVEVHEGIPNFPGKEGISGWHLKRHTVEAYAYLWSDASSSDVHYSTETAKEWNLRDYMSGQLYPDDSGILRISATGKGDEEGEGHVEDVTVDELERRNATAFDDHVAYGNLDYERAESFTGW